MRSPSTGKRARAKRAQEKEPKTNQSLSWIQYFCKFSRALFLGLFFLGLFLPGLFFKEPGKRARAKRAREKEPGTNQFLSRIQYFCKFSQSHRIAKAPTLLHLNIKNRNNICNILVAMELNSVGAMAPAYVFGNFNAQS